MKNSDNINFNNIADINLDIMARKEVKIIWKVVF